MKPTAQLRTLARATQLIAVLSLIAAFYFGQAVFIPLMLAILLAFLLSPIVNRIQRFGIGNAIAVFTTAFFAVLVIGGTLALVGSELTSLVTQLPQYKEELVSKAKGISGLSSDMGDKLDQLADEVSEAIESPTGSNKGPQSSNPSGEASTKDQEFESTNPFSRIATSIFTTSDDKRAIQHDGTTRNAPLYTVSVGRDSTILSWAGTVGSIFGPLGTLGLVTVFVLFLLVYREDMWDRLIKVLSQGNYVATTEALHEVSSRISKYLLAQTIVNGSYGFVLSCGLYFIGRGLAPDGHFPNFVLWGILATLLRFVPYVGPIVGGSFPLLLSVAVFPGYSITFAVLALIVTLELASNNVIEPCLYGASTGLSAIAIIMAAVFWGWLWGPVGLLLSTPLTVCLVVLGRHVKYFRIFSTLLGDENDIDAWQRFYQRMLAQDKQKALLVLNHEIEEAGPVATIDSILVPTLKRLRQDHESEQLKSQDTTKLLLEIESVIDNVGWSKDDAEVCRVDHAKSGSGTDVRTADVIACAAHHASEDLLLRSLERSLPTISIKRMDSSALVEDIACDVREIQPEVVLIVVLPTGGFEQARFLCRAIRKQGYKGKIIVCCCGRFLHFNRLFVKFRKSGVNFMTTNLTQTALKLRSLVPKDQSVEIAPSHVLTQRDMDGAKMQR
jgi:predicted PurR-regulated permease PerM